MDTAHKLELKYWQITEAGNELAKQDDDVTIDESLNNLEDTLNDLKEYARAGDKVKISLQSESLSGGKKKGTKIRTYNIYLKEPEQKTINGAPAANMDLMAENVKLKLEAQHKEEKAELLKRLEKLEAPEDEGALNKTIEGIQTILNHPITSLVISYFAGKKGSQVQTAPAINGIPDYDNLINRIEKIDPKFIEMLTAIVEAAESDANTYFFYRKQLVK